MLKTFLQKLDTKDAVIGIIGLGYVGLPLMLRYVEVGFRVIGFDIDQEKVDLLNQGQSYIKHIPKASIRASLEENLFQPTTNFSFASQADALLICVPTPLGRHRDPDLSYIKGTMVSLLPYLREGQLLSLESE